MIRSQAEAIQELKRYIDKWKAEFAATDLPEVAAWIAEGERLVAEYESLHAARS